MSHFQKNLNVNFNVSNSHTLYDNEEKLEINSIPFSNESPLQFFSLWMRHNFCLPHIMLNKLKYPKLHSALAWSPISVCNDSRNQWSLSVQGKAVLGSTSRELKPREAAILSSVVKRVAQCKVVGSTLNFPVASFYWVG